MWKVGLIAVGISILSVAPGMGMPGAIWFALASPVLSRIYRRSPDALLPGDRAWPFCIVLSLIWPISIPVVYWLCFRVWMLPDWQGWLALTVIQLVAGILLTVLTYAVTGPHDRR